MTTTELIALAEKQLADLESHTRALQKFIAEMREKECTCVPDCVTVCANCREYLETEEPFPY